VRIVVDIDGTLTRIKYPDEGYGDLPAYKDMVEWLRRMKAEGHTIVIYTARRMKTHGGNVGKIMAESGAALLDWLEKEGIPHDELFLGKPFGDIILDDQAIGLNPERPIQPQLASALPVFVIAAAGEGARFKKANVAGEKFEIEARGKPLTYWALKSLPLDIAQKIVVVGHASNRGALDGAVRTALADLGHSQAFIDDRLAFTWVEKRTRGQAETVMAAKPALGELWNTAPGVVYNIDTYFSSTRIKQRLIGMPKTHYVGLMGLFRSTDPGMSFARIEGGAVVETTEKQPISDLASTGLYAFRPLALLEQAIARAGDAVIAKYGELYIAPLYNDIIANGGAVTWDVAEVVHPIGTPTELAAFEGASLGG